METVVCDAHQQAQCEICFQSVCTCCGLARPCWCPTQVPHSCRALRVGYLEGAVVRIESGRGRCSVSQ